jgi:hypothetical protein
LATLGHGPPMAISHAKREEMLVAHDTVCLSFVCPGSVAALDFGPRTIAAVRPSHRPVDCLEWPLPSRPPSRPGRRSADQVCESVAFRTMPERTAGYLSRTLHTAPIPSSCWQSPGFWDSSWDGNRRLAFSWVEEGKPRWTRGASKMLRHDIWRRLRMPLARCAEERRGRVYPML